MCPAPRDRVALAMALFRRAGVAQSALVTEPCLHAAMQAFGTVGQEQHLQHAVQHALVAGAAG